MNICLISIILVIALILIAAMLLSLYSCVHIGGNGRETILERIVTTAPLAKRITPPKCECQGKLINIGDCLLFAEEDANGRLPLVLIPGGPGSSHYHFHPSFSHASSFADVIYYDPRGVGRSCHSDPSLYTVHQAVKDLDTLREKLGHESWFVLGWSFGGVVAQLYALEHPSRVRGLILVGTPSLGHDMDMPRADNLLYITPAENEAIKEARNAPGLTEQERLYNAMVRGDWKRQHFYRPSDKQIAVETWCGWVHDEQYRKRPMFDSVRGLGTCLKGVFDNPRFPIMIIEGKYDWTQGDKPTEFIKRFPTANMKIFDNASHAPFDDVPDDFFKELEQFVKQ